MGWPSHWGAAEGGACVSDYFISEIFILMFLIYSLYIPDIYPKYFTHISLVKCFLVYGFKSGFGHEQMASFVPISHASGP